MLENAMAPAARIEIAAHIGAKQANGCFIALYSCAVISDLGPRRVMLAVKQQPALVLAEPPLVLLELPLVGMDVAFHHALSKQRADRKESGKHNERGFSHGFLQTRVAARLYHSFRPKLQSFLCVHVLRGPGGHYAWVPRSHTFPRISPHFAEDRSYSVAKF